jgi:tRNA nucleotidyltransferase/poly(A) polymerase
MALRELLGEIKRLAAENKISQPFIVGGVPRDRVMGKKSKTINDIDLTTGDQDALKLGVLLANNFKNSKYRTYDDGHSSINIAGLRIDFSSNFVIPNIQEILIKKGVKDIDPIKKELYSRDFTMNTLLEDLDLSNVYDLTKTGVDDIKSEIIRCPIDPNITIGADPRRILRAIKYAIKFDFVIEDGLKGVILERRKSIANLPKRFVQDRMNEIVRLDNEKGLEMLIEFKLLPIVPLSKVIYDMLIQKRQLARAL